MGNVDKFMERLVFKASSTRAASSRKTASTTWSYLDLLHFPNREAIKTSPRPQLGSATGRQHRQYFDVVYGIEPKRLELKEVNEKPASE
jgi:hypothetical protein